MPREKKKEVVRRIAYFSMEVAITSSMPTYSGGLGVLAGDTIRAFADLRIPAVAVSLLYRQGYFRQKVNAEGIQSESPVKWDPARFATRLKKRVSLEIEGRTVHVQAWRVDVKGFTGHVIPVFFLDTDLKENDEWDRKLCSNLYGGDRRYRLAQEMVLGIAGVRMLETLGFNEIDRFHMNEGHASLLSVELLQRFKNGGEGVWDFERVRKHCVFTTHTPVPAGHDRFKYELVRSLMGNGLPDKMLKILGGADELNMTMLAMNLSRYVNGVAKQHGVVTREMFPKHAVDSITNGVHGRTWTCESFQELFHEYVPDWAGEPTSLRSAVRVPLDKLLAAHMEAKRNLLHEVKKRASLSMDENTFTIGFARRATRYKRADLVFQDFERLRLLNRNVGRIQFVFAGKAHPNDVEGKELIRRIHEVAGSLKEDIPIAYMENYDMELGLLLTSGVDLWLNTPEPPLEASGTSGMKAAFNGVPSLSVLDGWWVEGHIEGVTGWAFGSPGFDNEKEAASLYEKLASEILPLFYRHPFRYLEVMRNCIAINASFFNTHRMVQQYSAKAYL